jgi:hypothetical protein
MYHTNIILWRERQLGDIKWNYVVTKSDEEKRMLLGRRDVEYEYQKIMMLSGQRDLYNFLDDMTLLRKKISKMSVQPR